MPELDFDIYRQYYYWFQYHFFLRSRYESPRNILSDFLYNLYSNTDEQHRRWQLQERGERQPERIVKRPPRGMKKVDAISEHQKKLGAMPTASYTNVYIGKVAIQNSVRHRYMLFDYLRYSSNKNIWKNFNSLYRSLIIHDLHSSGYSFDDMAERWNGSTYLAEMDKYRKPLAYEVVLRSFVDRVELNIPTGSRLLFTETYDEHDEKQAARLTRIRIEKHYERASLLIKLAKDGKFSSLSNLSPLKH